MNPFDDTNAERNTSPTDDPFADKYAAPVKNSEGNSDSIPRKKIVYTTLRRDDPVILDLLERFDQSEYGRQNRNRGQDNGKI